MNITLPSGRKIGQDQPPFIVAEIGSNWKTFQDCLDSIAQAKAAGADAVKFQLFTPEALYGLSRDTWDATLNEKIGLGVHQDSLDRIPPYLNPRWLPHLKECADKVGIEFMCTAFSPELIDVVDPYVNIHKNASAELTHVRMLEKYRLIGKPVIVSTGAHGVGDVQMALDVLQTDWSLACKWDDSKSPVGRTSFEKPPIVLMYCVAAYPANEVNLENIIALNKEFGTLVGYSDHTTDVLTIPRMSFAWGSSVLEKHVSFIGAYTPDRPHSLDGPQFKRMVESIRNVLKARLGYTPEEKPMVLRHNRRLIAIRNISAGETMTENENFGIYRSLKDETHAYHPFMVDEVNGKIAKRDIKAGDGIGPGDI